MNIIKFICFILAVNCFAADAIISWQPIKNAIKYRIEYRIESKNNLGFGLTETVTSTTYTIKDLTPNQKYYFIVQAIDSNNNKSKPSNLLMIEHSTTNKFTTLKSPNIKYIINNQ